MIGESPTSQYIRYRGDGECECVLVGCNGITRCSLCSMVDVLLLAMSHIPDSATKVRCYFLAKKYQHQYYFLSHYCFCFCLHHITHSPLLFIVIHYHYYYYPAAHPLFVICLTLPKISDENYNKIYDMM